MSVAARIAAQQRRRKSTARFTPDPTYGLGTDDGLLQAPPCKQCGANGACHLGALGAREWFRCRQCGWTYSDSKEGA